MSFRIWFDDGSTATGDTEEEWNAVAKHGVLYVLSGGLRHSGMDYYLFDEGEVKSCSRADIDRYLERTQGVRSVKFGRWVGNASWKTVLEEVDECLGCKKKERPWLSV